VIDRDIKSPLSRILLFGDLKNGGELLINVSDGKIDLNTVVKEVEESVEDL